MRVIAGTARSLPLKVPPGTATRPTSDRVREAVFNALGSAGLLDVARCIDLFAGSGAMGIEALSRGVEHVTFVEADRVAADVIRANLRRCGFESRATVEVTTVERHLERTGGDAGAALAIIDPPYAYTAWPSLMAAIAAGAAVVESDRAVELGDGWDVLRSRAYGGTVVQIARRLPRAEENQESMQ